MTFTLTRIASGAGRHEQLAADARAGLTADPKSLPPKYFYDGAGSELFVQITRLPEYYQTRTETAILESVAADLVAGLAPVELVELGSGAARKTRVLLEAMHAAGTGHTYVPFDVSEDAIVVAADALTADYPWLDVHGIVGDFDHHLDQVPRRGRRLVLLLGSTIGNFDVDEQIGFLREVRAMLTDGDAFLVGLDLVKDGAVLQRAYDDPAGVTAAFNRNVLSVLNSELGADFEPDRFAHVARWVPAAARIEMRLRADAAQSVRIKELDLEVGFAAGEEILTEISCKFTRATAAARLQAAGLSLARWDTDPDDAFAVALCTPA